MYFHFSYCILHFWLVLFCGFYVFLMHIISLLKFSLSFLSILISGVVNFASGRLLAFILFSSFSVVLSCSFIWYMFLCVSFWLPPCVYFYVLGKAALSLSLGRMVLCSRCPVGPSGTVSLVSWAGCSRAVLSLECVFVPVVLEPWLLLAHQWLDLTLRLIGHEEWLWL